MERFWKRVRAEIKAHKMTQKKFAEYICVPRSTFYSWQKFCIIPDVVTAYNIATALGVSLEFLVTGESGRSERLRMEQTETRKSTEDEVKKLVIKLQEEVVNF